MFRNAFLMKPKVQSILKFNIMISKRIPLRKNQYKSHLLQAAELAILFNTNSI